MRTAPFNVADYLTNPEIIEAYIEENRNETIEECARAVEKLAVEELCSRRDVSVWEIVETIRALKDGA